MGRAGVVTVEAVVATCCTKNELHSNHLVLRVGKALQVRCIHPLFSSLNCSDLQDVQKTEAQR